jgi:hypothetical protein
LETVKLPFSPAIPIVYIPIDVLFVVKVTTVLSPPARVTSFDSTIRLLTLSEISSVPVMSPLLVIFIETLTFSPGFTLPGSIIRELGANVAGCVVTTGVVEVNGRVDVVVVVDGVVVIADVDVVVVGVVVVDAVVVTTGVVVVVVVVVEVEVEVVVVVEVEVVVVVVVVGVVVVDVGASA